ncbi:MAG: hypothetical protein Q9175_003070 [Cornicularia normoerica]
MASSSCRPESAEVISKIEAVFENIADSLLNEENPYVPLNDIFVQLRYKKHTTQNGDPPSLFDVEPSENLTNVSFPARGRPKEAWRFMPIHSFAPNISGALTILQTAAAKGLVAGNFILTRVDGAQAYRKPEAPYLIDDPHDIQAIDTSDIAWILSTFRTLASSNLHQSSRAGNGIILTAKGYPDISTRSFLRLLSTSHDLDSLPPPIYALTDLDPDGLAIMSTYKHGSFKLSHENAGLNVPSIQWLGVQGRDVLAVNGQDEYSGLLRLSTRDRKKAVDMLERSEVLQEHGKEEEWRRELQVMLMLNVKAEMEVLAEREGGVRRWVEEKLLENGTSLHADEDLLETHQLADMRLGEEGFSSLQANEEFLLDTHETPKMLTVGEGSPGLQVDEDLLDTHQMAGMSLAEEYSPISQLSGDLLEAHQLAGGDCPSFEWDEEL